MMESRPDKSPRANLEDERTLEVSRIFEELIAFCDELGYEFEFTDLEYILGEDENDFLGNLISFALEQLGLDHEELFERLGIDAEFKFQDHALSEIIGWPEFQRKAYMAALRRRRNEQEETRVED